ncbi:MAG: hypothetical protein NTV86_02465 [Planctomycetota bacterium]|nr:hypothetical protein [Planctomycetota bacterium]
MKYCLCVVGLSLVASCAFGQEVKPPMSPYDPPFIISAWCGPEGTLERYKEYADCGFNVVLGAPKEQIPLAKAVGIKAIASGSPADVPAYSKDPTVVGLFLADEPGASYFPELAKQANAVRKANPRYIPYVNLLPTYATPDGLGTPTYEEHVRRYIETVKPPFVSWDHYALYGSGERPDYFENLEIVSRLCRQAKIPFVQIILSMPHFSYRDPNEADLRWQVYTTLAYGAKGVIYFTYITPAENWCWDAIIDAKGRRTAKYEYTRRINRKVNALAPVLAGLEAVRVAHSDPVPRAAAGFDDNFPVAAADGMPMTVGWLRDAGQRDYLFVVNRHFDYHQGLIRNWEVSGPFTQAGKTPEELFDVPFPPESADTAKTASSPWPAAGVRTSGKIDVLGVLDPPNVCVAYLRTRVKSPARQEALLRLGLTTGTKAWLNGKPVFAAVGAGERKADVKVVLEPGPNTLLVKLTRQGQLGIWAQFLKPDGSLLDGLDVARQVSSRAGKADGTVALREGVKDVVEISQESGQPVKAAFDPAARRLAVSLEPGEGRLFRLEHTDPARAAAAPTAPATPKTPAPVALRLDSNTGVVLEADRNGLPAGTTMFATAACMDYCLLALVDGVRDRKSLGWQGSAWASLEDQDPHGLEIRLGKPVKGGRLQITWAFDRFNPDHGHWFASRNFCIQVKDKASDAWKTVADVKGNASTVSSHPLPKEPFNFLRLYQLPGGGDATRPNILWIGQLELTDAEKE